jgi:uncharacterized membrane protein
MRRQKLRLASIMIAAMTIVFIVCGGISAKEYKLPEVYIEAHITSDGSIIVSEQRTYLFSGSFSWASMWFPNRGEQVIEIVSVAEGGQRYSANASETPGTYQVSSTAEKTSIKWFFSAEDQERTFIINYRVRNAVQVYSDVAELYWKFIGEGWDIPTQHAIVDVILPSPAPADSVRVWGHGPLHGHVSLLDDSTARWEINNLPARTFMEARITFPPELVPGATIRQNNAGLPGILAEEEVWADQANRIRGRARLDIHIAILALILVVLAAVYFYYRFARPFPSDFQGTYYRDLPADYPPVVLGVLWRGYGNTQDMAATLMDLLRRKQLQITQTVRKGWFGKHHEDFVLTLSDQTNVEQLNQHERLLIQLLFEDIRGWLPAGDPVTIESIKRYAQNNKTRFTKWYKIWQDETGQLPAKYNIFDTSNRAGRIIAGVIAFVLAMVGFALLMEGRYLFTGGSLLIGALVAILCATLSRRHTP